MDPSDHPATSGKPPPHPSPDEDDETVVTPTRGERVKPKERKSVEKTLKFRFVPSRNNDSIPCNSSCSLDARSYHGIRGRSSPISGQSKPPSY
jgi:hypothetical protein